jgi:nitrate reductase gamma subunit
MIQIAIFSAASALIWAIAALLYQWRTLRGHSGDHSTQSGNPQKGVLYNFTIAMLPSHKETIRLHPVKFIAGILMHIGMFAALASTIHLFVMQRFNQTLSTLMIGFLVPGLIAGVYLLVRRLTSPLLKSISAPDDYFAVTVTNLYIMLALLLHLNSIPAVIFLFYSALLFIYLPLGKLKHAVFFFAARADYGRRLGYRGVYPVDNTRKKNQ